MSIHNSNRVKWMTQVAADFFPGAKDYEALVSIAWRQKIFVSSLFQALTLPRKFLDKKSPPNSSKGS